MSSLTRREFASRIAGAASAGLAVSTALADDSPAASKADETKPETPEAPPLAYEDHQLAVLKELFPAPHLTEELYQGIRAGLAHNRAVGQQLRQVKLPFEVEPALIFQASRSE